mmetsp:Transcript_7556/g.10028  ORF Transcript_7556/g.10028 Transcript_7556/m.10028 type:complete len:375 (+) Transcript_7556:126-1250(+)
MTSMPRRRRPVSSSSSRTFITVLLAFLFAAYDGIPTVTSFSAPSPITTQSLSSSTNVNHQRNIRQPASSLDAVGPAVAATAASALALPSLKTVSLACLIPTLSGFYKSEYGVSYAYGTAMTATSLLVLRSLLSASAPLDSIAVVHAAAVLFYGVRLNLFLAYREIFLPRFRHMRERIEDRAKSRGSRLSRTPFIVSCAALYAFLATPFLVTSKSCAEMSIKCCSGESGVVGIIWNLVRAAVVATWGGFLIEAWGDFAKSIGKAQKGEDALITGGIFRFFRHPNYTGEIIGWASSCVAAFLAVAATSGKTLSAWMSMAPSLIACVLGASGISFVLTTATAGLERRQLEKYGDTDEYKEWVGKSWVGFQLVKKNKG